MLTRNNRLLVECINIAFSYKQNSISIDFNTIRSNYKLKLSQITLQNHIKRHFDTLVQWDLSLMAFHLM